MSLAADAHLGRITICYADYERKPEKPPDRRRRYPYCTSMFCAGRRKHARVRIRRRLREDFFCPDCGFAVVWLPNESLGK